MALRGEGGWTGECRTETGINQDIFGTLNQSRHIWVALVSVRWRGEGRGCRYQPGGKDTRIVGVEDVEVRPVDHVMRHDLLGVCFGFC